MDLPLISAFFMSFALTMYVMLDGFDLGVGALLLAQRDEQVRDRMVDAIAPTWDGNETWLIMAGVTLLAGFPLAYGILIPALYVPVVIMLLSTAVLVHQPEGDPHRMNPLYGLVLPALARHELSLNTQDIDLPVARQDASYNLGTLLGLPAWLSLVPPALLWGAVYLPALVRTRRNRGAPPQAAALAPAQAS